MKLYNSIIVLIVTAWQQDQLRMNVAGDQTIILGLQIILDHRSSRTIDQKLRWDGMVIIVNGLLRAPRC